MDYVMFKQASKKWGISPRMIAIGVDEKKAVMQHEDIVKKVCNSLASFMGNSPKCKKLMYSFRFSLE